MSYEQFISSIFSDNSPPHSEAAKRTTEDILAEIMPIVEADKKRGG